MIGEEYITVSIYNETYIKVHCYHRYLQHIPSYGKLIGDYYLLVWLDPGKDGWPQQIYDGY